MNDVPESAQTQREKLLGHLKAGLPITAHRALYGYSVARLAARIHDLKHTFGRRLKAAGVTEEDRKALLGHKNGSITSHYSGAELGQLIDAANRVSATDSRGPVLTILKRRQA